jgi:hypothetical protein
MGICGMVLGACGVTLGCSASDIVVELEYLIRNPITGWCCCNLFEWTVYGYVVSTIIHFFSSALPHIARTQEYAPEFRSGSIEQYLINIFPHGHSFGPGGCLVA